MNRIPTSNSDGDEALARAIVAARARGGIAIVIAHRKSALSGVDLVMTMAHGRMEAFGPKDEILGKLRRPVPTQFAPLRVVNEPEKS